MTLEFKLLSSDATAPTKANITDAGYDIYASETVTLAPQEKHLLKTDLAVNIPVGYVGLLTSRSGVSSKTDIVIETGKIDTGYTGEMKINVKNDHQNLITRSVEVKNALGKHLTGNKDIHSNVKNTYYTIHKGDKIAQLVIVPVAHFELKEVQEFTEKHSERNERGFGDSGI